MAEASFAPLAGMVSLRGDLASGAVRAAVAAVAGEVPDTGRLTGTSERGVAWMSPDELLLLLPRDEVAGALASLSEALAGEHHLALDVSDLRAAIRLDGPGWREVLGKLTPADLHPDAFGSGVVRRSHLGQVAAAFWAEGEGARVLCFRSVADHALALLRRSAADGDVGYFGHP